jgi:hypothetical protein
MERGKNDTRRGTRLSRQIAIIASALPIIVSSVAGCAADLVEDGWQGYVLPPRDVERLRVAIDSLGAATQA